jgi:hypothetical protein
MDPHEPISPAALPSEHENEKSNKKWAEIEVDPIEVDRFSDIPATKVLVPDEHDEFIDPRLKDYPIPLVA